MSQLLKSMWSSVGKKFLMAITGLAMVIFLVEHVFGNLLLFSKNPDPYNKYAHFLMGFGSLLILAELVLIGILLFHVISAISITHGKHKARPVAYVKTGNAGEPSKKTFASKTMIWTGLLTFVFIAIHLKTFKFGPAEAEGYVRTVDGVAMRDLHTLVWDVFQNPIYMAWYVGALIFLGFHLRHGFWSAFQSLGVNHPRYTPIIYSVGILVAIIISVGFLGIPLWIYFTGA